MNIELLTKVAYQAGFRHTSLLIAICVGLAESKGDPQAEGDVDLQTDKWGPSVGLWQIRSLKNSEKYTKPDNLRVYDDLFDPIKNAEAAFEISKHGTDFSPWSTFINNDYRQYINIVIDYLNENKFNVN